MGSARDRHAHAGGKTDEGLEIVRRLWREESVDFHGAHYRLAGASIAPKPVQPELPLWIGGGSAAAIRRTARIGTGWLGGPETPAEAAGIVAAIRAAAAENGRTIEPDHYGAGFACWFGSTVHPAVRAAMAAYAKRTGRDPAAHIVAGDAAAIVQRIAEYVDAGVAKFVLRPIGSEDAEILAQTRLILEQVLPLAACRWPKRGQPATSPA